MVGNDVAAHTARLVLVRKFQGGAAAILGIPASTFESKIRRLRISKHVYKDA